jgi:NADPH:quinone reductase-like Zn-dependent oxidoreductase
MRALELFAPSLDSLHQTEQPNPSPRRGEALVKMQAASLNFIDIAVATGAYPGPIFPLVPVADGAGEVVAIGEEVETVKPGDRVIIHPKALWVAGRATARTARAMRGVNLPGTLRELATVSADTLVKAPDHLSWQQAAALPIAATTAWNALAAADIGPGSMVVLLGTGGVSIHALQLAKARGAGIIIASSADEKLARAQALGADHLINYRANPAWNQKVMELTDGVGADLVIETAGVQTFARSMEAVRQGGTIFTVGFVTGTVGEIDLMPIITKSIRVQGFNTGSAADLADAVKAVAAHRIEPVVDRIYGLGDVREAYEALARGGSHFGKLAITVDFKS